MVAGRFLATPAIMVLAICGCWLGPRPFVSAGPNTGYCDEWNPCGGTYYWDHWRGVYVYYDGHRYFDALGTRNTAPLPPSGAVVRYPPRGYVAPSVYRAPIGAYRPPPGYVAPPPNYYTRDPAPRVYEERRDAEIRQGQAPLAPAVRR